MPAPSGRRIVTALSALAAAVLSAPSPAAPPPRPPQPQVQPPPAPRPLDNPGAALRKRIERLLAAGKVEDALKAAEEAVTAKGTAGERAEYVDLHMTIARHLIRSEDFRRAEELLLKVTGLAGDHAEAAGLLTEIRRARAQTPAMLERAGQFASVERWGPALRIWRKAAALLPERERGLRPLIAEAHREAADQHYRVANWAEALAHYNSAAGLETLDDGRQRRRLHAAVFHAAALMRAGRVAEPTMGGLLEIGVGVLTRQPDRNWGAMLAGLYAENSGKPEDALRNYAVLTGRTVSGGMAEAARERAAALAGCRKLLVRIGPESRPRLWQDALPGEWLVRETDRFVIHHHNDRIARRVADALEFYFVELLNDWDLPLDKMAGWKPKLKVYLYRNEAEYRAATGIAAFVPAFGRKPKPGIPLTEHSIHCYQNHPGLLSSILPHELAHMMLAYHLGYPAMATGVDEGLALTAEPDYMRTYYRRTARERTAADQVPTLAKLLAEPTLETGEQASVYYARSLAMIEFLRARVPPTRLLEAVARMPAGEPRSVLAAAAGMRSADELEAAWRQWWK